MDTRQTSSNGVGLSGLLLMAFIILRIAGIITWSWWWVFAPLWIPLAVSTLILLVIGVVVLIRDKMQKN